MQTHGQFDMHKTSRSRSIEVREPLTHSLWARKALRQTLHRSNETRCHRLCKILPEVRNGSNGGRYAKSRLVSNCTRRRHMLPSLVCKRKRSRTSPYLRQPPITRNYKVLKHTTLSSVNYVLCIFS